MIVQKKLPIMERNQSNSLTWDSYSSKEYETQELLKLIFIRLAEIKEMLANEPTNENLRFENLFLRQL